jgi:hypothetical protein
MTVELGARAEREHEREHVPDQPEREREPRHQGTPGSKQQSIELGFLREPRRGDVVVLARMQRRRRVQHSTRLASVLEHAFEATRVHLSPSTSTSIPSWSRSMFASKMIPVAVRKHSRIIQRSGMRALGVRELSTFQVLGLHAQGVTSVIWYRPAANVCPKSQHGSHEVTILDDVPACAPANQTSSESVFMPVALLISSSYACCTLACRSGGSRHGVSCAAHVSSWCGCAAVMPCEPSHLRWKLGMNLTRCSSSASAWRK